MMQKDTNIKALNTLRLSATAKAYQKITKLADFAEAFSYAKQQHLKILALGEGSNIILDRLANTLVLDIQLKGITVIDETDDSVTVKVAAGENWHAWVQYCLDQQYFGLENLALIPGRVGAAPIQNIGAYGVEVGESILSVDYIELESPQSQPIEERTISNKQCLFAYRDSVFKHDLAGKVIITAVTFKLSKTFKPHITYPALKDYLLAQQKDLNKVSAIDVFNAVCAIRSSKLPDPKTLANVGSFFKNMTVSANTFEVLKKQFPEMPSFYLEEKHAYKIPSAWLIDYCGFKGKVYAAQSALAIHKQQALVIVNYDNKEQAVLAQDVLNFAATIRSKVKTVFNLELEIEPVYYKDSK